MTDEYQENNQSNSEDLEIKVEKDSNTKKTSTTFFEKFESNVDWNLISIFSIWIFLSFTFFCIFVKY